MTTQSSGMGHQKREKYLMKTRGRVNTLVQVYKNNQPKVRVYRLYKCNLRRTENRQFIFWQKNPGVNKTGWKVIKTNEAMNNTKLLVSGSRKMIVGASKRSCGVSKLVELLDTRNLPTSRSTLELTNAWDLVCQWWPPERIAGPEITKGKESPDTTRSTTDAKT